MRARRGGVDPFRQIDQLRVRFEQDKKRFRAAVKERLGAPRALRVSDVFYTCRWKGTTYRAQSVDALLEKLPQRGAPKAAAGE